MTGPNDRFIIGAPRYSFAARPLSGEEYLAISKMLLQRVRKEIPGSGWRRMLGLLPFIAIGGLAGFLIAHYKVSTVLMVGMGDNPRVSTFLDNFQFELIVLFAFIAGIILQFVATLRYQKKFHALALKRSKTYSLPQSIALTDNALVATCALGVISCAWERLTHRYIYQDLQVLIFDQAFLVWLPQAEIEAADGLAAFLNEKSGIALQ